MADKDDKLHIAMFPWVAFGHMIPFLELAKLFAHKGHRISFISTPRNIDRLPKLPPNLISTIDFIKLPLTLLEDIPENAEATIDIPESKVPFLKKAYDSLQHPVTQFLQVSKPDWVFYDFAPYWVGPIATELGIKAAFFSIMTAALLAFLGPSSVLMNDGDEPRKLEDLLVPPKWVPFPTTVSFKYHEVMKMVANLQGDDSGVSDLYRFGAGLRNSDIVTMRSCLEFEPEWLRVLENIHNKPVFPVGQLPPLPSDANSEEEDNSWRSIKEWLEKQGKGSVIYVAFGSEAKPSQDELTEIALGLERSELPFFWVLRTRRGSADTEEVELPQGFEKRTRGRGVVYTSWAPQMKILSHDSVGGVLSHSGWSTVVEALMFGRPLVLLTFFADQGINARVLEEKKIGYSITRDENDGSFSGGCVAESLKMVLVKQEGKIYRDKAVEMKGLFGDRDRQSRYVDNLLDYLKANGPAMRAKH
ncbi:UDP-glycosyltransferase 91A1-like [Ziziphus jujuba]|uniref:UDP-glycosyltransferase 91A1-like n=1 Tax=Ziziphus jujuba TaxID=326968 RepID=A0A6P4ANL6_ZIZJJ|nr:UDP-glycosyltransferase 91A1-like [Ziziphus jujuba]